MKQSASMRSSSLSCASMETLLPGSTVLHRLWITWLHKSSCIGMAAGYANTGYAAWPAAPPVL